MATPVHDLSAQRITVVERGLRNRSGPPMTSTTASSSRPAVTTPELVRTARTTGLLYLGLVVTGLLSFLLVRNQLYVADDAAATLASLTQHETLARLGIVTETGVVITQALVALWFYRLFRSVNAFAAVSIAAFGLVNSVAILGSAAMLATALDVSQDASLTVSGGAAVTVQLLYVVSGHLWLIGGIFFGLWLIPMGWLARRSAWMPRLLGWLLSYLLPDAGLAVALLTAPATVGELWMAGYLCIRGIRRP